MAVHLFYFGWVYLIEELNQKIVYFFVTSFDIPKPIITKPMIIITMKCGKVGVTILKLLYELDKCGVTKVETSTEDAIKDPTAIRTMLGLLILCSIPIMKEVKKSKMDVPPNSVPLSLEESDKNAD